LDVEIALPKRQYSFGNQGVTCWILPSITPRTPTHLLGNVVQKRCTNLLRRGFIAFAKDGDFQPSQLPKAF